MSLIICHAENAVHRRADLVAHRGEEFRLGPVRGAGLDKGSGRLGRLVLQIAHDPADKEIDRQEDAEAEEDQRAEGEHQIRLERLAGSLRQLCEIEANLGLDLDVRGLERIGVERGHLAARPVDVGLCAHGARRLPVDEMPVVGERIGWIEKSGVAQYLGSERFRQDRPDLLDRGEVLAALGGPVVEGVPNGDDVGVDLPVLAVLALLHQGHAHRIKIRHLAECLVLLGELRSLERLRAHGGIKGCKLARENADFGNEGVLLALDDRKISAKYRDRSQGSDVADPEYCQIAMCGEVGIFHGARKPWRSYSDADNRFDIVNK